MIRAILIYSALALTAAYALAAYAQTGGTHWPLFGTTADRIIQCWGDWVPALAAAPLWLLSLACFWRRKGGTGGLAAGLSLAVLGAWVWAMVPVLD